MVRGLIELHCGGRNLFLFSRLLILIRLYLLFIYIIYMLEKRYSKF